MKQVWFLVWHSDYSTQEYLLFAVSSQETSSCHVLMNCRPPMKALKNWYSYSGMDYGNEYVLMDSHPRFLCLDLVLWNWLFVCNNLHNNNNQVTAPFSDRSRTSYQGNTENRWKIILILRQSWILYLFSIKWWVHKQVLSELWEQFSLTLSLGHITCHKARVKFGPSC